MRPAVELTRAALMAAALGASACADLSGLSVADGGDAEALDATVEAPPDGAGSDAADGVDATDGIDAPDETSAQVDAAGDACATPCDGVCCAADAACIASPNGSKCVKTCAKPSDCSTGCCAPALDANGAPTSALVCKPNDGQAYDCCFGVTNFCGGSYCCVLDDAGNEYCALPCTQDAQCGSGHCDTLSFKHSTCSGPTACGP